MMKTIKALGIALIFAFTTQNISAHCEIPCGIYNDSLRITLLYEHIVTIEKSMNQIIALEQTGKDANQLIRWVNNKEDHAKKMQAIISDYFMHQRIKPIAEGEKGRERYIEQLELMHRLSIYAMKSKQTTDVELIAKMQNTLHKFEHAYFEKAHKH